MVIVPRELSVVARRTDGRTQPQSDSRAPGSPYGHRGQTIGGTPRPSNASACLPLAPGSEARPELSPSFMKNKVTVIPGVPGCLSPMLFAFERPGEGAQGATLSPRGVCWADEQLWVGLPDAGGSDTTLLRVDRQTGTGDSSPAPGNATAAETLPPAGPGPRPEAAGICLDWTGPRHTHLHKPNELKFPGRGVSEGHRLRASSRGPQGRVGFTPLTEGQRVGRPVQGRVGFTGALLGNRPCGERRAGQEEGVEGAEASARVCPLPPLPPQPPIISEMTLMAYEHPGGTQGSLGPVKEDLGPSCEALGSGGTDPSVASSKAGVAGPGTGALPGPCHTAPGLMPQKRLSLWGLRAGLWRGPHWPGSALCAARPVFGEAPCSQRKLVQTRREDGQQGLPAGAAMAPSVPF